jgi:hypothetical protein
MWLSRKGFSVPSFLTDFLIALHKSCLRKPSVLRCLLSSLHRFSSFLNSPISHRCCPPPLRVSSRLLHPPCNLQPLLLSSIPPRSLVCRGLRLLAHNTRTPPRAMQDYPETLRNLGPRSPRRTQQGRLPRSLHYARRILLAQVRQELLLYKPPHVRSFSICLVLYMLFTQNDG